jgi:hypothetical protein
MADDFYTSIEKADSLDDVFGESMFKDVPRDWWIALTDVVASTKAIEEGRYKEVNSAGSLPVMAISNYLGNMDFPFLFGGDGVTCLVPAGAVDALRDILIATVRSVKKAFDLDLRLALIPVKDLRDRGRILRVARWEVSPHYTQAIFEGDGFDEAESILKSSVPRYIVPIAGTTSFEPNFTGYTCRWQDFPSSKDETIALLVKFRKSDHRFIRDFLKDLQVLVGTEVEHHPLRIETHRHAFASKRLRAETAIRAGATRGWRAFAYLQKVRLQIIWVMLLSALRLRVFQGRKDLSLTKQENIASSDFRKYDNAVKMILAVTRKSREGLQKKLEDSRAKGDIFYGIHVSDRATITCLMHTNTGAEVHFVDAADGGYAIAAKQIKAQIKEAAAVSPPLNGL